MRVATDAVRAVGAAALVAALVLAGCGGGDDGSEARAEVVEGGRVDVEALDNRFRPEEVTVRAGTEVRFVNEGRNVHDVIPVAGGDFEVPRDEFQPGGEATFTLEEAGTYGYYCSIHGTESKGMIGTIVVVA